MQSGDILESRFRIEREAGSGAMGVVYRAYDTFAGEAVAVKVIKGERAPFQRFKREARLLARLRHPAIVRYVAHGTTPQGAPYLAMEWLEGEDLAERLCRGPLGVSASLQVAHRVADALALAHSHGIVHRDLKPGNLFLPGGNLDAVKLLDFGIARAGDATSAMTAAGVVIGTPGYMAPEQARGEAVIDARVDVFALGCVLFECIAGRPVFLGDNMIALLAKILLEEPPRIGDLRRDVPRSVDDLVTQLLSKAPAGRPRDGAAAREVIAAVEGSLEGATTSAERRSSLPPSITRGEQQVISVVISATEIRTSAQRVTEVLTGSIAPALIPAQTKDARGNEGNLALADTCAGDVGAVGTGFADDLAIALARFGARVERLADGIVVVTLHGAGVATDQAALAARCALSLRISVPNAPMVLATGRGMVAGRLPLGPVIEKAARMLRALGRHVGDGPAPIHVDDVTAGLLPSRFKMRPGTTFAELTHEQHGADLPRRLLGRATPFLGRDPDLSTLMGVFAEVESESIPRAVVVAGAPGLGKSRLREEFVARLRERDPSPEVWIGAAEPLGSGAPLCMLARALRGALGVVEDSSVADAQPEGASVVAARLLHRQRLVDRVRRQVGEHDVPRISTFLGELVGLPLDGAYGVAHADVQLQAARRHPPLMAEQMQRAFVDFLGTACLTRPVVLVLEDAHWGDLPTMKFIDTALRDLGDRSVMVIAFGRPELEDAFPSLWRERGVLRIALVPLTHRASERLAREVLGKDADPDVVSRVVQQAAGNPFFLEELLRAVATGTGGTMPETVLAIIQKRLETLDEEARRLLRAASVFGVAFWLGAAAALLGTGGKLDLDRILDDLVDRELLMRRSVSRVAGEVEYAFRHALVRDGAYGMLTDADRALGHRLAGAWLESVGEHNQALLAEHFERGNDKSRAMTSYLSAARQALDTDDLDACLRLAARGLSLGAGGELRGSLHLARAEAQMWRANFADARLEGMDALRLLPRGSDERLKALAATLAASATTGSADEAETLAAELIASPSERPAFLMAAAQSITYLLGRGATADKLLALLPESSEDDPLLGARVHLARAMRSDVGGDPVSLLNHITSAASQFERAGDTRSARAARANAGYASTELGRHEQAEQLLGDALKEARRSGAQSTVAWATQNLGIVLARLGRTKEGLTMIREAADAARQQGDLRLEAKAAIAEAGILMELCSPEQAEKRATHALSLVGDVPPLRAWALAAIAAARLGQAAPEQAHEVALEAMRVLESGPGVEEAEPSVRLVYAEALLALGDREAAARAIAHARRVICGRAERIAEPDQREAFLRRLPVHARILAVSRELPVEGA